MTTRRQAKGVEGASGKRGVGGRGERGASRGRGGTGGSFKGHSGRERMRGGGAHVGTDGGGDKEDQELGGKEGDEGRRVTSYKRPRDAVMTQTMTSRDGVWEAGTEAG